jgi:hypothetical protein
MNRLLLLAAVVSLTAMNATAATAGPTEHELHTAQCVAALKANTEELAVLVKGGRADLQPLLLMQLKYGAAFIGDSYLQGERDEVGARALLNTALEAQKVLPAPELAARQSDCATEGAQLLAKADSFGRAVVSWFAEKRMKKLLEG